MKLLLIAPFLFFFTLGAFSNERQREIEYKAINLAIKKYGKGLENRLKGTGVSPSYRIWYENDFDPFAALGFSGNFDIFHVTTDCIRKFFHRLIAVCEILVHCFLADLDHSRVDIRSRR